MSDAPTSAGSSLDLQAALAAGWSTAELVWEVKTEEAAALAYSGELKAATDLWRDALAVAREEFAANDPRLGTSLANQAYGLRQSGKKAAADRLAQESLRVWDAVGFWINAMTVERRARSSLFHLRMEALHRDKYETVVRQRLSNFAEEARLAVHDLASGGSPPLGAFARWKAEKPPIFGDSRRLLAACLLLVSRSG